MRVRTALWCLVAALWACGAEPGGGDAGRSLDAMGASQDAGGADAGAGTDATAQDASGADAANAADATSPADATSSGDATSPADASSPADGATDADATSPTDATTATDAASPADAGPADSGQPPRCASRSISSPPLTPLMGELFLAHIGLEGLSIGEATVAQLPDGTRVLIDVGNDSHARDVIAAVDSFFGARTIELMVLTHHHADHEDALPDILDALSVGTMVHRGLTDFTAAANETTVGRVCAARARTTEVELCTNGLRACDTAAWSVAATGCPGLPYTAGFGALEILAANGTANGMSLRPLLTQDNNGENARSLVGVLKHGAFRYVFAGDLTGGGSNTDAVEAFMVSQLGARLPPADVLHLSHHARDTSSSTPWIEHLLPADGRPRHAVAGISSLHVGSPHALVVRAVEPRLNGGGLFVTRVAATGESTGVIDARGGTVRVQTFGGGAGYLIQAVDDTGTVIATHEVSSAGGCVP